MTPQIELRSDLNAEDDDGQNWTLLEHASNPAGVRVGAVLIAGTPRFWSVVRITAVDADGQVHFVELDESAPAARELARHGGMRQRQAKVARSPSWRNPTAP